MPDKRLEQLDRFIKPMRVEPGRRVRLPKDFDPGYTGDFVKKEDATEMLQQGVQWLSEFQMRLAAQDTWSLLVIFQAMDAAGKDGTIRHVMSGVNPQGVEVTSFKVPSTLEQDHDYLWRSALRLPARGMIGIFNRSYYEETLVVRVHPADPRGPEDAARSRRAGTSGSAASARSTTGSATSPTTGRRSSSCSSTSRRRSSGSGSWTASRSPSSNWKFSASDARERRYWDDYQKAFADVLSNTSTPWAPWHVIPADRKWFMRVASAAVILDALMEIDPKFPKPTPEAHAEMLAAKEELLAEDGKPAAG